MMTRRDAAIALDIPMEMAKRHGIAPRMSEKEFAELNANPPAWLVQSRANRKAGARPVWVHLTCIVCGQDEYERPKKWWPNFDFVHCAIHSPAQLPALDSGKTRVEYQDISARMFGIVDEDGN
ncbi:hypothetical protein ACX5K5_10495 [Glutamicibacter bergerei]|uniref:Uncharacterized protein n=2 Tax=Glutamicibacter TaxID=1742989 RepID=A0ABV9MR36_9MICC|nr:MULTISPECIES: hypothetical protein [Micrococcaceae]PCC32293.1 hypothetical protein CIK74_15775 [Glutamicibacter sp. BW77]PRB71173.1 hypothetical protein CQ011_04465 [Arthrobacter sp. MYb213]HBV10405.1 hypothetical protein [Micrococcaceae bacterium]